MSLYEGTAGRTDQFKDKIKLCNQLSLLWFLYNQVFFISCGFRVFNDLIKNKFFKEAVFFTSARILASFYWWNKPVFRARFEHTV